MTGGGATEAESMFAPEHITEIATWVGASHQPHQPWLYFVSAAEALGMQPQTEGAVGAHSPLFQVKG